MISSCFSALNSFVRSPFVLSSVSGLGMVGTIDGIRRISEGDLRGFHEMGGGLASIYAGTTEGEEERCFRGTASVVGGTVAAAASGLRNAYEGIHRQNIRKALTGAVQFAAGAAGTVLAASLPSKVVFVAAQALTLAGLSGMIACSGVQDVRKRQYLKGGAKILTGLTGIAASGWCAFKLLGQPDAIPEPLTMPQEHREIHQQDSTSPSRKPKRIKLAMAYNNNGDVERDKISALTVRDHRAYANKWGIEHEVVTRDLVAGKCTNPFNGKPANCVPHMNKIEYLREQCAARHLAQQRCDELANPQHAALVQQQCVEATQRQCIDLAQPQCAAGRLTPTQCADVARQPCTYVAEQHCAELAKKTCAEPWIIIADDDGVFPNKGIDPDKAIDRLRNGDGDTSVVMMHEGPIRVGGWLPHFPPPKHKTFDPRVAVNTGFIMMRVDEEACDLIEETWNHRNTPMDPGPNYEKCPTIAFCKTHGVTSLGDQTAMAVALQDRLDRIGRTVTLVLPRDNSSPYRADIAFNTLHRNGCHQEVVDGKLTPPFDIDDRDYPDGMMRRPSEEWNGDWYVQTAGFRLMGKYPLPRDENGQCMEAPEQPIKNIRWEKVEEMMPSKPERDFTFAIAEVRDENPEESQYGHLTLANHREYAERHGAKFYYETDKSLLKDQCEHPHTKEIQDCSPYFMKVRAAQKWLNKPGIPGKESWLCIGDNDGVMGNMGISPDQLLDDLRGPVDDPSILVAKELQEHLSPANTGFICMRKDERSRKFVEEWWNQRNVPTVDPQHPTCPSHGLCKNQFLSLNDQSAFGIALFQHPEVKESGALKIVPIRSSDRPYGVNTIYRPGCFFRDQAHWKSSQKIDYEKDDWEANPEGVAQPGDYFTQAAGVPRVGRHCNDPEGTLRYIRKEYIMRMLSRVRRPDLHVRLPSLPPPTVQDNDRSLRRLVAKLSSIFSSKAPQCSLSG